eukprot:scaffold1963_cov120-Isochrysis_galbana.AAC.1
MARNRYILNLVYGPTHADMPPFLQPPGQSPRGCTNAQKTHHNHKPASQQASISRMDFMQS